MTNAQTYMKRTAVVTEDLTDADAKWAAAVERAANRKPNEAHLTLPDREASKALVDASLALADARQRARIELVEAQVKADPAGALEDDALSDAIEAHGLVVAAQAAYDDAEQAAADLETVFHLRQVEPNHYDALQVAHPATDEQEERGMHWDPATYFPALLAASSVKPLTEGQAAAIINAGTQGDVGRLIATCRNLNEHSSLTVGKPAERGADND